MRRYFTCSVPYDFLSFEGGARGLCHASLFYNTNKKHVYLDLLREVRGPRSWQESPFSSWHFCPITQKGKLWESKAACLEPNTVTLPCRPPTNQPAWSSVCHTTVINKLLLLIMDPCNLINIMFDKHNGTVIPLKLWVCPTPWTKHPIGMKMPNNMLEAMLRVWSHTKYITVNYMYTVLYYKQLIF